MTALEPSHHRASLAVAGLVFAVVAGGWSLAVAAEPDTRGGELVVSCDMDICIAEVDYVLAVPRDGHEVTFVWRTTPAAGYPDNRGDLVVRTWPAGIGEADDGGYRYRAGDFIWHSDIRCDDTVTVAVLVDDATVQTATVDKPVPERPEGAHCSDYGMSGEVSARAEVNSPQQPKERFENAAAGHAS